MQTVLFTSTIFGPIHSRRLGVSLGINLSPADGKICSFDCLYCEAGFNAQGHGKAGMPTREEVARLLEQKLIGMKGEGTVPDVLTFSGNGEPTLHPQFEEITEDVIALRDKYFPDAKISVLSNSTMLGKESVCRALMKVDNNILKLDSALDPTIRMIDRPLNPEYSAEKVIERISRFTGQVIVQTMFLRGEYGGRKIDNTTPEELDALARAYLRINPREIMIYSIDRKTPAENLQKVDKEELERIADFFRSKKLTVKTA